MAYADPESARAYRRKHSKEATARAKAWVVANPERARATKKAWEEKNRDLIAARNREYYIANRDKILERARGQYQRELQENPEARRARARDMAARRRARLRAAKVECIDLARVWERDKGVCGICHHPVDSADWHLDHIVALVNGGEHSYANVQVSHPICNWRKAAS